MEAGKPRRRVRPTIVKLHRWLGLGVLAFWLLQALTGLLLSFHWEIEDSLAGGAHPPTNLTKIERSIADINQDPSGRKVNWIWTSAGLPDRYVLSVTDADKQGSRIRIDGEGAVLQDRKTNDHSFLSLMRELHLTLLSGSTGEWILAISGIVLISNLIFGLVIAWPKRRADWRRVLVPIRKGAPAARLYSWHRAVGLWGVIPAIVVAGTGSLILFEHELREGLGIPEVELPANPARGPLIGLAEAAAAGTATMAGSVFVGTTLPTAEDAVFHMTVRGPDEPYRSYGGSQVVIDAHDGRIIHTDPLTGASAGRQFVGWLYPLHTGEAGGLIGRVLTMLIGLWLIMLITVGTLMWIKRRRT